jgi:integrase
MIKDRAPQGVLCWKARQWPDLDREGWFSGLARIDEFDDIPIYGSHLRLPTVQRIEKGYGRWIRFLQDQGWLDHGLPPLERVTRRRLIKYFKALRKAGNADWTIKTRFDDLQAALRIMTPMADVRWIVRPWGITINAALTKATRPILVPDSGVLLEWGIGMMDTADLTAEGTIGLQAFRDGLLVAMLASRARRARAMAGLRIGAELLFQASHYRIELGPELVKTNKADRFDLPDCLTPYIKRYLTYARPALLGANQTDALWINTKGGVWTQKGMAHQITKLAKKRFGIAFGPHRFRHATATTSALRASDCPGLAASVLGISRDVIEQHYNRAGQVNATIKLNEVLDNRRDALQHDGDDDELAFFPDLR